MKSLTNFLPLFLMLAVANGLQGPKPDTSTMARRKALANIGSASLGLLVPSIANAGIDPSLLQNLPVQGDESGASQRLRQVEAVQRPASDLINIPYEELPSGVSYREYREGKGEAGTLEKLQSKPVTVGYYKNLDSPI